MDCHKILKNVEAEYLTKNPIPDFRAGDVIRVHAKVVEGESERIQPFEGVVLYRKGSGVSANYTVRKVSFGVGIERTFPLHSPRIVKIELIKSGKSRRARLYYLRKLSGKAARLVEKEPSTESKGQSSKKDKPEPALSPT